MTAGMPVAAHGLRTRNKLDKLRRIKQAAQDLFIAKGFDDTTMREIADRADVGLGTIFLYARNKRDLLFLSINEPLEEITQKAEGTVDGRASLIENLLSIAKSHYRFFGRQPALSRLALREMTFYESGAQAAPFQKTRERLIRLFGHTIGLAVANGEISPKEPPLSVGWTLFCIFQVELRRWLASDTTDLRTGLAELERGFRILIGGLGPAAKRRGRPSPERRPGSGRVRKAGVGRSR